MAQTTSFPLGAMVGGPNGSDPVAMARFEAQYRSFTELMGAPPLFMNAFVDPFKPISDWAANSSWTAWSWRQSSLIQDTIPVIGMPMSTEADRGNTDPVYKAFAAGVHDGALRGIIESWASHGYKTLYFRPGYEMNGTYMAWYSGADAQTRSDWVAAFRHISEVVRSVPGVDVKVIWNPTAQSWNEGGNVLDLYPGDQYVDVIGADIYSPLYPRDLYSWSRNDGSYEATFEQWMADPVNRVHYWTYPDANRWHPTGDGQGNSLSLQGVIDFAIQHNKPFALPETGSGSGGNGTQGPNDDPAFAKWLATTLAKSGVKVAMVNIWDLNPGDGNWTFSGPDGNKPLAAAAWAEHFGTDSASASAGDVVATGPREEEASAVAVPSLSVGAGPDAIVLTVSEDAWQGDAQFTVSVDGQQVGGVLTATAAHGGPGQTVAVQGSFGTGSHTVGVAFLNDGWGGTAQADRNLYVESLSYGGVVTPGRALMNTGTQNFRVGSAAPLSVGAGPDSIELRVSQDAWQGSAQYTVNVDGRQVGGVLTAAAAHGEQAGQAVSVLGDFGPGLHTVGVAFLNDAWGGMAQADRNLYVESLSYGGVVTPGRALMSTGTQSFRVGSDLSLSVGDGPDAIVLTVSEDAWQGHAQFTVSVDGRQVGGVLTAAAPHGTLNQTVAVKGAFGPGMHDVGVAFLNDGWGGTAQTDRNLYVESLSYGGVVTPGRALMNTGTQSFRVGSAAPLSVGAGPDAIVLTVSEDAWQGHAQFTVSVDGRQVGGVLTATAAHGGTGQTVAVQGSFGTVGHTVGVTFLNDAWGGTAQTDRNLYVDGIAYRSATVAGEALTSGGTRNFALPATASITAAALEAPSSPSFLVQAAAMGTASSNTAALADAAGAEIGAVYTASSQSAPVPVHAESVSMAALLPSYETPAPSIPLALSS